MLRPHFAVVIANVRATGFTSLVMSARAGVYLFTRVTHLLFTQPNSASQCVPGISRASDHRRSLEECVVEQAIKD